MKKIKEWFSKIPQDKLLHFSLSGMITLFASHLCMRFCNTPYICINVGVGAGLTFGLLKEIIDSFEKDNKFDWNDILADVLGCISGALLAVIPFL